MICPNCHVEVSDELNFCENCGTRLAPPEHAAEPQGLPNLGSMPEMPADTTVGAPAGAYAQPSAPEPSIAPFVLSIIALVLALLFLFPLSLILAIIALVMNARQKRRGEFGSKQTPTFVMGLVSLILSILMLIFTIAITAFIAAAAQSGAFDDIVEHGRDEIASVVHSDPVTSVVGSWEVESMVEDGENLGQHDLQFMRDIGIVPSLTLNEDGTASITLFGESGTGTWEDLGDGSIRIDFVGETLTGSLSDGKLTLNLGSEVIVFHPAR